MLNKTWNIWFILLLLFLGNRPEIPFLGFWGRYLPSLGVVLFAVSVITQKMLKGDMFWQGKFFIKAYAPFFLLMSVSSIYNDSEVGDLFLSFGTYLRYPFFFLLLINANFDSHFFGRIFRAFIYFSLFQVPIVVVQFLSTFASDRLTGADSIVGTMGSNQALIAVMLFSQCMLISRWLVTGRKCHRYLFAVFLLAVPSMLGDIKVGWVFLPVLVLFVIFRYYGLRRFSKALVAGFSVLVIGLIGLWGMHSIFPTVTAFTHSIWTLHIDWTDPFMANFGSLGRVTILYVSIPLLLKDPIRLIWGFGPEATYGGARSTVLPGYTVAKIPESGCVCQQLADMGILCRESQIFKAIMEFGFLGSFLYILPILLLWRFVASHRKQTLEISSRATWLAFEGALFFFTALAVWYIGAWRLDSYCFPFWLIAGAAYSLTRAEYQKNTLSPVP